MRLLNCPSFFFSTVPCDKQFTGNSGSFTSPLYPQKYPNNKECAWVITVPLNRLLRVRFLDFNLEKHSKCSYDRIEVYDGGTLKSPKRTFCGQTNPGKCNVWRCCGGGGYEGDGDDVVVMMMVLMVVVVVVMAVTVLVVVVVVVMVVVMVVV